MALNRTKILGVSKNGAPTFTPAGAGIHFSRRPPTTGEEKILLVRRSWVTLKTQSRSFKLV
jgi:hypothetical protein